LVLDVCLESKQRSRPTGKYFQVIQGIPPLWFREVPQAAWTH
jgi:hypothetical protein